MQRPVWACTIKVSVATMSEDPARRLPSSSIREPLSLFPGRLFHTSNAMFYSDLFCQPIKPKAASQSFSFITTTTKATNPRNQPHI
ncbi:uncharacterized protein LOC122616940 [Drosophila teissieri]|uniref:uncharacterized protein LOC122616940 n=1 Tax=Drosophila teissieri TaxID=7243 RepID=UPI001CBA457E|nr:uncharacterized protein LOC122616940 [Drosophila teissieri]